MWREGKGEVTKGKVEFGVCNSLLSFVILKFSEIYFCISLSVLVLAKVSVNV